MTRSLVLSFLCAIVVTACGGGGGGDSAISPGTGTPPPASGLTITSSNVVAVTKASWDGMSQSVDIVGLVGVSGLIASNPGNINKLQQFSLAIGSGSTQGVPLPETVVECLTGTVTVSGEITDLSLATLAPGDFINTDYANCDEGFGEVINGLVEMRIDGFSGDLQSGLYDLSATFTLTNVQITTAEDDVTSNGVASVMLDTLALPAVSASISGASLTTDSNVGTVTLRNFESTQTIDLEQTPSPFTQNSSGSIDSSQIQGSVSYATPMTFSGFDLDFPSQGEMRITGENSSALIIALDNVNVRIEIFSNGSNTPDTVIDTTWVALTS